MVWVGIYYRCAPNNGHFGTLAAARCTDAVGQKTVTAVEVNSARARRVRTSGKREIYLLCCCWWPHSINKPIKNYNKITTTTTTTRANTQQRTSATIRHPTDTTTNQQSLRTYDFLQFFFSARFVFVTVFFIMWSFFVVLSCALARIYESVQNNIRTYNHIGNNTRRWLLIAYEC